MFYKQKEVEDMYTYKERFQRKVLTGMLYTGTILYLIMDLVFVLSGRYVSKGG
jgi:uncharacterized membrane protein YesL